MILYSMEPGIFVVAENEADAMQLIGENEDLDTYTPELTTMHETDLPRGFDVTLPKRYW